MTDRVVHILRPPDGLDRDDVLYIGRAMPQYRLSRSIYANPFRITGSETRTEVIARYAAWLAVRPEIIASLRVLPLDTDVVFACWCTPLPCHGEILVALRQQWREEAKEQADA